MSAQSLNLLDSGNIWNSLPDSVSAILPTILEAIEDNTKTCNKLQDIVNSQNLQIEAVCCTISLY